MAKTIVHSFFDTQHSNKGTHIDRHVEEILWIIVHDSNIINWTSERTHTHTITKYFPKST